PGIGEVFKIALIYIGTPGRGSIFPDNIDKASLRKLPGVNHIYIKIIDIGIWIAGYCRNAFKSSIIFEVKKFVVIYFTPIMPCPEGDAHLISEIVFNIENVFYSMPCSKPENAAVSSSNINM
ncbi:MAG: hypothetical protein JWQ09_2268, partial [Segetibacter sp.]|nr:hypothetical protein [Segetibacter sp.]